MQTNTQISSFYTSGRCPVCDNSVSCNALADKYKELKECAISFAVAMRAEQDAMISTAMDIRELIEQMPENENTEESAERRRMLRKCEQNLHVHELKRKDLRIVKDVLDDLGSVVNRTYKASTINTRRLQS